MINEQKGVSQAQDILEDLGFDTLPILPTEVVNEISDDSFKVVFETESFDSSSILGKAIGNERGALICINSNIPDERRINFTAAHEIGHVCMHIMEGKSQSFECGNLEFKSIHEDPLEKEANGFASGLLMPKQLVLPLTDGVLNWTNIDTISRSCNASLEATYRRFSVLYKYPSAMVIHEKGLFKRYISSDNFGYYVNNSSLSVMQKNQCIDSKIDGFTDEFEESDASDWVSPIYRSEKLNIIYSSSIILKNNFIYTLLTYDDECLLDVS